MYVHIVSLISNISWYFPFPEGLFTPLSSHFVLLLPFLQKKRFGESKTRWVLIAQLLVYLSVSGNAIDDGASWNCFLVDFIECLAGYTLLVWI